jgi:hypothetical protein
MQISESLSTRGLCGVRRRRPEDAVGGDGIDDGGAPEADRIMTLVPSCSLLPRNDDDVVRLQTIDDLGTAELPTRS